MTAIEQYQPEYNAIATMQDQAVQRLGEWAQSADAAYRVAQRLVDSSFVPQGFRGKPVEATAAILAGIEVGLSPMSALRAFDVIQGQAAARAITLRAIVQSAGHEMVLVESTDTRCRMKGRRKGTSEWQGVTWTIDRAKALALTGKDNWKKQPGAMLVARATSELARLIASDAILGIGYSAEEVADGSTGEPAPTLAAVPTTSGTRRMSRRKPEQTPEPDPITDKQMAFLQAYYSGTERDDRLEQAGSILGRAVDSFSNLTKDDASNLIDALQSMQDAEADDEANADDVNADLFNDGGE